MAPPDDYSVFIMTPSQTVKGALYGVLAGEAAMYVLFGHTAALLIALPLFAAAGYRIYKRYLKSKRKKELLTEFRDFLESLSNSFLSGRNIYGAFDDALADLESEYGKDALMTCEAAVISGGLENGRNIEELLNDFASRASSEDISDFADTFSACCRTGGDLRQTVTFSRDIICEKIAVRMEIAASVASGKNELNILSFMPFAVVTMMRLLNSGGITANTPLNIAVKTASMMLFAFAYFLGMNITDIRV
ncbi:MAG: hypothetical protein MJ137_01880 [Clostridia bacterium]|nr:hypothetical protein [Clostridia bacterium]